MFAKQGWFQNRIAFSILASNASFGFVKSSSFVLSISEIIILCVYCGNCVLARLPFHTVLLVGGKQVFILPVVSVSQCEFFQDCLPIIINSTLASWSRLLWSCSIPSLLFFGMHFSSFSFVTYTALFLPSLNNENSRTLCHFRILTLQPGTPSVIKH